jgi:1,4-dihydroxy-2-naphthoyl-CoA hydrolase
VELSPEELRTYHSPFDAGLGIVLAEASGERVVATLPLTPKLHQPGGIVHGGVYATMVESTASVGASLWLDGSGYAVGISNHTDFVRSARDGELRGEATPLQRGRLIQVWQVDVTDTDGRRIAHGKVTLVNRRLPEPS